MNKRRCKALLSWLEAGAPEKKSIRFSMCRVYEKQGCGAVCCMAGAAVQFFGNEEQKRLMTLPERLQNPQKDGENAAKLLGINEAEAVELFFPMENNHRMVYREVDTPWAARCLRKFIETGVIDWLGTKRPTAEESQ